MGKKVHPYVHRLGTTTTWKSKWFAGQKNFKDELKLDLEIRKHLEKEFKFKAVSNIEVQISSNTVVLEIHAAKPGLIIGQQGSKIDQLKDELSKKFDKTFVINIHEIAKPSTDAKVVCEKIVMQLEHRISFRRAAKAALEHAMNDGAKGIKVKISGRLNGVDIARSEFFIKGRLPLQTIRSEIDYSYQTAATAYGVLGIKVWIYKGDVFNK